MPERVAVYNLAGQFIADPEEEIKYASNITIETAWPKGFMTASFQVKRSDVFAEWVIRESFGVIIYDGADIVFDGRIEGLPRNLAGSQESITVLCVGWHVVLEERDLRKRWVDIKGVAALEWPTGLEIDPAQGSWLVNKRDNIVQVFAGSGDLTRVKGEVYREIYRTLTGGTVRRVSFSYIGRTGERLDLGLWNVANSVFETTVVVSSRTPQSGTLSHLIAEGDTPSFELRWQAGETNIYDQRDYIHLSKLRVETNYEAGHSAITNPAYSQGELVEDVILLANQKGEQLSTDFSQLGDPGFILDPFAVEEPQKCVDVINKIASYGDASLNTWGLAVWDRGTTTDNKPRVVFEARSVEDYEYVVELTQAEMAGLTYEKISEGLKNSVTVSYRDDKDITRYRTAANVGAEGLADAASIANEYQRDHYISLGEGDNARAIYAGSRFIEYHKDRRTRGGFSVQGFATTKQGGKVPANRVRAGQRVKLVNTGEIFFIRSTGYDSESQTVRVSPDLPEDNLSILFTQRERNLGKLG